MLGFSFGEADGIISSKHCARRRVMGETSQHTPTTAPSKLLVISTTAIAAVLLIVFASMVWFNRYIFDTETFTATATPALTSDSSTKAIATEITDRLLEDRPVLKQVLSDRVITLLAALLTTDLSDRAIQKAVSTLQITMTSNNPQPVEVDLSGLKALLSQLLTFGRQLTGRPEEEQRIDPESIPDSIVLLDQNKVPNVYALGVTLMWLAPVLFIAILVLIGYTLYKAGRAGLNVLRNVLLFQGVALFGAALLAFLIGPLLKPQLLGVASSPNIRTVTENLYNAFVARFNDVALSLILVPSLILLIVALGIWLWPSISHWVTRHGRTDQARKAGTNR